MYWGSSQKLHMVWSRILSHNSPYIGLGYSAESKCGLSTKLSESRRCSSVGVCHIADHNEQRLLNTANIRPTTWLKKWYACMQCKIEESSCTKIRPQRTNMQKKWRKKRNQSIVSASQSFFFQWMSCPWRNCPAIFTGASPFVYTRSPNMMTSASSSIF